MESHSTTLPGRLSEILREHQQGAGEQLRSFWRALEHAIEDRCSELAVRLEEEFAAALETRRADARRELCEQFRHAMRRFRQAETNEEWAAALVEATAGFCARAVLFAVEGQCLKGVRARGLGEEAASKLDGLSVNLKDAPAFRSAIESRDAVVALRAGNELSAPVADLLGEAPGSRACLLPITAGERPAAILYADGDAGSVDLSSLELIAAMSEGRWRARAGEPAAVPVGRAPAPAPAFEARRLTGEPRKPPDWSALSRQDQELHLRAQRFARVQVAEMRLYRARAVRAGRERGNLYGELKDAIDAGREAFQRHFIEASPTMVDYFHLELVRTLANDDAALLGQDYPGPLV